MPVDTPLALQPRARSRSGLATSLAALAGPMMVAIAAQALGNLVFHAVLGRSLPAADYGALGAVLAAMTLVAVPLTALQTSAARTSAAAGLSGRTGRAVLAGSARVLLVLGAITLALGWPIKEYLHLDPWVDAALLAPTLVIAGLLATARGLLLGVARTRLVAGTYLVSTAIRLVVGIALVGPLGVTGALLATVIGEFVALLMAVGPVLPTSSGTTRTSSPRDLVRTTLVVTGLFAFTTIDLFLARNALPGAASGAYVAAATIGKTVLALPAAAVSVVYPRLVSAWVSRRGTAATLRSALLVVAAPALLGSLLVVAFPELVLTVLYGDSFAGSETLVQALAAIAGTSALVSVLAHGALARRSRVAMLPWLGAGVQQVAVATWHSSPMSIAAASAASLLLVLGALSVSEYRAWTRRERRAAA